MGVVWCGWGSGAWLRVRVSVDPMLWAQRPAQQSVLGTVTLTRRMRAGPRDAVSMQG